MNLLDAIRGNGDRDGDTSLGRLRGPGMGKGVRTYQLGLGEVPLPPQVPVHGRKHRQAVVGVHEDVDEAIQGRPEETCMTVASSGLT